MVIFCGVSLLIAYSVDPNRLSPEQQHRIFFKYKTINLLYCFRLQFFWFFAVFMGKCEGSTKQRSIHYLQSTIICAICGYRSFGKGPQMTQMYADGIYTSVFGSSLFSDVYSLLIYPHKSAKHRFFSLL